MTSLDLKPWQFLLALNVLLLVVGCLMDIMSAIFIFVPLLAPMALAAGVDPLHLGIIFIVNLEIGYLTPPVGLNLFVASTLFGRPLIYMIRAVLPFIVLMMIGLALVTYVPSVSVGLANVIMGEDRRGLPPEPSRDDEPERPTKTQRPTKAPPAKQGVQSIEQMMQELQGGADGGAPDGGAAEDAEEERPRGRVQSIEEMMREVEKQR
jgi:C4-dicarboxylate transporter DctM subunit